MAMKEESGMVFLDQLQKKPGIPGEADPGRHSADRPGNVPPEYQIRHGAKAGTRVCGSALSSDLLYTGNFRAGTA